MTMFPNSRPDRPYEKASSQSLRPHMIKGRTLSSKEPEIAGRAVHGQEASSINFTGQQKWNTSWTRGTRIESTTAHINTVSIFQPVQLVGMSPDAPAAEGDTPRYMQLCCTLKKAGLVDERQACGVLFTLTRTRMRINLGCFCSRASPSARLRSWRHRFSQSSEVELSRVATSNFLSESIRPVKDVLVDRSWFLWRRRSFCPFP